MLQPRQAQLARGRRREASTARARWDFPQPDSPTIRANGPRRVRCRHRAAHGRRRAASAGSRCPGIRRKSRGLRAAAGSGVHPRGSGACRPDARPAPHSRRGSVARQRSRAPGRVCEGASRQPLVRPRRLSLELASMASVLESSRGIDASSAAVYGCPATRRVPRRARPRPRRPRTSRRSRREASHDAEVVGDQHGLSPAQLPQHREHSSRSLPWSGSSATRSAGPGMSCDRIATRCAARRRVRGGTARSAPPARRCRPTRHQRERAFACLRLLHEPAIHHEFHELLADPQVRRERVHRVLRHEAHARARSAGEARLRRPDEFHALEPRRPAGPAVRRKQPEGRRGRAGSSRPDSPTTARHSPARRSKRHATHGMHSPLLVSNVTRTSSSASRAGPPRQRCLGSSASRSPSPRKLRLERISARTADGASSSTARFPSRARPPRPAGEAW